MSFENKEYEIMSAQKVAMENLATTFLALGWLGELLVLCLNFIRSIVVQAKHKLKTNEIGEACVAEVDELKNFILMGEYISSIGRGEYLRTAIDILATETKRNTNLLMLMKTSDYDHEKHFHKVKIAITDQLVIEKEFGIQLTEYLKLVVFRDVIANGAKIYTVALKDTKNEAILYHNPQHYPVKYAASAVECFMNRFFTNDPYYVNKATTDNWEMEDLLNCSPYPDN